jgi:hypothetical protein
LSVSSERLTDRYALCYPKIGIFEPCHHYYGSHCYLPRFIFEGLSGQFITAAWRPGKRPTGAENAMIVKRVLQRLHAAWPDTHLVLRGDSHFANPELIPLVLDDPQADFIFGLSSNAVLKPWAQPFLEATRHRHDVRCENARRHHQPTPAATQTYHELDSAAQTWPHSFRVVLKAEVMALGDNPRFVVTSLERPTPESLYRDLYCARGQDENWIKRIKNDLASDRTSDHRLPFQPPAPVFRRRRLCPASGVAHRGPRPYRTGQRSTRHSDPETVQNRRAGGSVQGPYQQVNPSTGALAPLQTAEFLATTGFMKHSG